MVGLLRLYRDFKSIGDHDPYGQIRFYEQHEAAIRRLELPAFFDCTLCYAQALMETGQPGKHIFMCDRLLELIIGENIHEWKGEDPYRQVLFDKALSLFRTGAHRDAEHVLRALVRLAPEDKMARRFLQTCLLHQKPAWLAYTRATSMVLLFATMLVIGAEIFFLQSFWPEVYKTALIAHNVLLFFALAVLGAGEFGHAGRCYLEAKAYARHARKRKADR